MSWNLWPSTAPELPRPEDESNEHDGNELELLDDSHDAVQILSPEEDTPGCWHVRPISPCDPARPSPAVRQGPELRRHRATDPAEQPDLRAIGLPEHLVPPKGGIFALLAQLERMPPARLPSLRPGDEVAVVSVRGPDGRRLAADSTTLANDIGRALCGHGAELDDGQVHVFEWPLEADPTTTGTAEAMLVDQVRSLRARLEFIAVQPDCAATVAYAACRALPTAQLYLTGVIAAHRPAAPLGWGAPVAFVDGRPATPAVLAAVLADRLAGGVG